MTVTLRIGGSPRLTRLLEVSERGMQLACPDPPPSGSSVSVESARIRRRGTVRWARGGAIGVSLAEPLSVPELVELAGMGPGL
jgi:hypothetical protein